MWSIRTKLFLQAHGHYIWLLVVTGYDSSKKEKTVSQEGIEEE
jgi:hypothetical protein